MAGTKFVIATPFTDLTLPILYDDGIMSPGSLILVDPAHSANPLSGVPANNGAIPNIAWSTAAAALGSGDINSLACIFQDSHQAADAIFERTSKLGLHAIYSQVNNTNNARGAAIRAPALIEAYLQANPTHKYYFSQWQRVTRVPVGTPVYAFGSINNGSGATSNYLGQFPTNGSAVPVPTTAGLGLGSRLTQGMNALGNVMRNVGANGWTGTAPTTAGNTFAQMALFGNFNAWGNLANNVAPSVITYRLYLEDLTVSGRTYAQVDALDLARYTADVLTAGGRYYGDTFTAPSTFP